MTALVLVIVHEGDTVCETRLHDQAHLDALLARHAPPQARGSVACVIRPDLPRRHPKRQTIIATSVHSIHGPVWALTR